MAATRGSGVRGEDAQTLARTRRGGSQLSIEFAGGMPPDLGPLAEKAEGFLRSRRVDEANLVLYQINTLLAASGARCTLTLPDEPVGAITDTATGRLIYRCGHDPAHRWDLSGQPLQ